MTTLIDVAGDRRVAVQEFGDPKGRPVVYLHGAGTSLLEAAFFADHAAARGVRLIAIERPGSGESTPDPRGSILDHVADVMVVADELGLDRFAIAGASGGSMYAAGVAAQHADRVDHFFAMVPVLPLRVDAVRQVSPSRVRSMSRLAGFIPGILAALMKRQSVPDEFAAAARRGGLQGSAWAIRDFVLLRSAWGFDPFAITVPATVITGESDPLRPVGLLYAQRLKARHVDVAGGHLGAHTPHGQTAVVDAMATAPKV